MKKKIKILVVILVLLGFMAKGSNSLFPLVIQRIIDSLTAGGTGAFHWLIVLMGVSLLIILSDVAGGYLTTKFSYLLKQNYRVNIMKSLYRKKTGEFYQTDTADYISMLNNNVDIVVENYYVTLLTIFKCSVTLCVSIASLIYLDIRLLGVVLLATILPLLNPLFFGKRLNQRNNEYNESLKEFNGSLTEFLNGYLFAKVNQYKQRMLHKTEEAGANVNLAEERIARTNACSGFVSGLMGYGGYVLIIGVGAGLVGKNVITIGALFAAIQIADNIAPPMTAFSHLVNMVKSMKGMKTELDRLADAPKTEENGENIQGEINRITIQDAGLNIQNRDILKQINLTFEKGKKYLVVGRSGSGKSSILKLISGVYEPTSGSVQINGISREGINEESFFDHVGIVEQDSFILNDTLERNVFLGEEAGNEKKKYVEGLLNLQSLFEHINWNTNCRNGGYGLSGGEKQRLALVRMMVKEKEVILLDEPTSALDPQTRRMFDDWIFSQKDKLIINISHNLEPELLQQYDRVIYMEDGQIKKME